MPPSAEILPLRDSWRTVVRQGLTAHRSSGAELDYFAYVPANATIRSPVMVSVHGIERRALQHVVRFSAHAEQHGLIVLAPLFSKARMPRYQRAARSSSGECPIAAFDLTVAHFQRALGLAAGGIKLFGYSGGAQFAMRYVLLGDTKVDRLVLAAPGWFTMPDHAIPFPYGLGPSTVLEARSLNFSTLLAVPLLLVVGEDDTRRDASLNREPRIDEVQGTTRVERAQRWHSAMDSAAALHGVTRQSRLSILPGAGHDFDENMRLHDLGKIVCNWLTQ